MTDVTKKSLPARIYTWGLRRRPRPLRGGVTNWAHEAGRWFRNGPVGGVGLWRKFRHCYASDDGCPCSNSGADHNCCVDDDCGSNYDCSTYDHNRADYDCGTNNDCGSNYDGPTNHDRSIRVARYQLLRRKQVGSLSGRL